MLFQLQKIVLHIFADKLVKDTRQPLFTFSIPHYGTIGFLGYYTAYWIQIFGLIFMNSCISVVSATILFYLISAKKQPNSSAAATTITNLIGYGIILPMDFLILFKTITYFGIKNASVIIFGVTAPRMIMFARGLEILDDRSPNSLFAIQDLRTFLFFYIPIIRFKFDSITTKNNETKVKSVVAGTYQSLQQKIIKFLISSIAFGTFESTLSQYNSYKPFPVKEITPQQIYNLLYWGNLFNNYCHAYITFLLLSSVTQGLSIFIQLITRIETIEVTNHALTASKSPSDFWGKRWNVVIHELLKSGIYKPVREYFSRDVSVVVTFIVSGLAHEVLLYICSLKHQLDYQNHEEEDDNIPSSTAHVKHGYHLAFFTWNGIVLIFEYLLSGKTMLRSLQRNLPSPIITILVIMTVLPIANWFTDEFVSLGILREVAMGFPRVYVF